MTAFVAGATGYTGREVVRVLVGGGVRTVAHVRPDSRNLDRVVREITADGAESDSTPWDESALTATLSRIQPDVVFALLGTTRTRARAARLERASPESYETVD